MSCGPWYLLIVAEKAIALSGTLSGGALFATWGALKFLTSLAGREGKCGIRVRCAWMEPWCEALAEAIAAP